MINRKKAENWAKMTQYSGRACARTNSFLLRAGAFMCAQASVRDILSYSAGTALRGKEEGL